MKRIFAEASKANSCVQTKGSSHSLWGDGSLMSAALRRSPGAEPTLRNADYCRCLAMVFSALSDTICQPRAHDTQFGTVASKSNLAVAISSPQSRQ